MATSDYFPTSSDWKSVSTPALPTALTDGVKTLGTITSAIITGLGVAKTALQALDAVQITRLDLTQAAVTAASTAIDAALKSLENSVGVYFLLVPPRRQVLIPTVVQEALAKAGLPAVPTGPKDLKVMQLQTTAAALGLDPVAKALLDRASTATGGSTGFLRTVLESLTDEGDPNRPQLAATDAVGGSFWLGGAPDYASVLSFLASINSLVSPGRPATALDAPDMPIPQDLHARNLGAAGVQLTWKPAPIVVSLPVYSSNLALTEVAIIRSSSPKLLAAKSPLDVFNTLDLTEGLSGNDGATVIKLRTNATGFSEYLDTSPLTPGPAYYALSYHYKTLDGTDRKFGPLSNAVKLSPRVSATPAPVTKATPPDWYRTPSPLTLFPGFASVVDYLTAGIGTFKSATLGSDAVLKSYITFLDQEIAKYTAYSTSVLSTVNQIAALANVDVKAATGIYSFEGTGGNGYLVNALTTAVSQLKFADTHFVGGFVVLVAGPSPAVVAPVVAILNLLFGTGSAEQTIVQAALAGINDQVNVIKAATVGEDFQAGGTQQAVVSTIPSDGCTPFTPTIPTIKPDFTV